MQRILDEFWARRRMHKDMDDDERMFWDDRRRFNYEDVDYMEWCRRSGPPMAPLPHGHRPPPLMSPFPHMPVPHFIPPGRRPESSDDRHVLARHSEIYPADEELQAIQCIVSHTERALKSVSDTLSEQSLKQTGKKPIKVETSGTTSNAVTTPAANASVNSNGVKKEDGEPTKENPPKEDGRDNQL